MWGHGQYHAPTRSWEYYTAGPDPTVADDRITWADLVLGDNWQLVVCDLHSEYGIDLATGILRRRWWSWLRTRLSGLLAADTRIARKLNPPETPEVPKPRR